MAFTKNPNYLWDGKPLSNCSHDELVDAVTLLLKKTDRMSEKLRYAEAFSRPDNAVSIIDYDDDLGLRW